MKPLRLKSGRVKTLLVSSLCGWALQSFSAPSLAQTPPGLNLQNRAKLQKQTQTQSYSFVVAGDNRDGDAILLEIFKRARHFQPRFMLHSGDFVPEGRKQEYLNFLSLLKQAPFPVLPAIGNHEIYHQGRRWYTAFFGPSDFVMDYGPDRFVWLDNAEKRLTQAQLNWLNQVLSVKKRYKFLIMHHPPQNIFWFYAFNEGSETLIKIAEKHRVNYVFMGHIHIYDKMESEGVKWLISGGAGAPLYRMPLYFSPEGGAYPHFLVLQVGPKGITEKLIRLDRK